VIDGGDVRTTRCVIAKKLFVFVCLAGLTACFAGEGPADDQDCVGDFCSSTGGKDDSWTPEPPPFDNHGVPEQLLGEDSRISPLYVMGDVNEDGAVDYADYKLIKNHVMYKASPKTMDCYAAADFDLNGAVDSADLELMHELADGGNGMDVLTLYSDPTLPCKHSNMTFAAKLDTVAGGEVPVRFVDGEHSIELADAVLTTENATLTYAADGFGYTLTAAEWAEAGDYIGLQVQLTSGVVYLLSIPIVAAVVTTAPANVQSTFKAPAACPQKGKGCVAFLLDFSKYIFYEFDADELADSLPGVGCTPTYVAPNFRRVPQVVLYESKWVRVIFRPSASAVTAARTHNAAQWTNIRSKWTTWKQSVAQKDMAMVIVNGHGSSTSWSAGFDTGSSLNRATFHSEFYAKAKGAVCSTITHDMSCYAGHTPRIVQALNNTGSTTATTTQDHTKHAGYEMDVATGTSSATATTSNIGVGARVDEIGQVISAERTAGGNKAPKNHHNLAKRFRTEAFVRVANSYSDEGYAMCGPGKHH